MKVVPLSFDLLSRSSGNPSRSGKLGVLVKLLEHWQRGGHKALIFTQTQQMLDIVEKSVRAVGYTYHRYVRQYVWGYNNLWG